MYSYKTYEASYLNKRMSCAKFDKPMQIKKCCGDAGGVMRKKSHNTAIAAASHLDAMLILGISCA